jgi:medium-chain acyl-[acyl-carrier-protein] hydrolase
MNTKNNPNAYLATQPENHAPIRGIFFSYAGNGASVGIPYRQYLQPHIDLIPIQLPGRENRIDHPPITNMNNLINDLIPIVAPILDRPFFLWGHCLGGLIAYELALALEQFKIHASCLIASACPAPQQAHLLFKNSFCTLDDETFLTEIDNLMKGDVQKQLTQKNIIKILLPGLKADFSLYETYQHNPSSSALHCPIHTALGTNDHLLNPDQIADWKTLTRCDHSHRTLPNQGHYFIDLIHNQFAQHLKQLVTP